MSNADDDFSDLWEWCAEKGVVSKKLFIRRNMQGLMPHLSLHVGESVRAGAVVLTVPYLVTLNAQTIRGDMKPLAVPSVRTMCAFLTRRRRMDIITAKSLWLSSCVACYRRLLFQGRDFNISPLFSRALMPLLPSPFVSSHVRSFPSIASMLPEGLNNTAEESFLSSLKLETEGQLRVTHAALQFYQKRHASRISSQLVPSLDELRMAYRTVMHRSMLLPLDCVPSAPGDLADLFTERPDIEVLPSFVPLVDIIRSPSVLQSSNEAAGGVVGSRQHGKAVSQQQQQQPSNCALYTCTHADFVSSGSRRRVVFETSPLSSRRVVVCAMSDLKEGDELLLDYSSE
ncbi:uncharacterized protein TM35_000331290 [Trypanosoma theileri]|uniref:SET domain-containing protein n=1 Tax=Trypanosoma theileri TaxID=67003 RepID=A0A1X0NLN1_9TRYP|nr:uncharacterized protein TM35_000331290 [Trypanosoma theileri]ORC85672.1 hypothetical protein TM35_000331290 [Trypanosoma theileri]